MNIAAERVYRDFSADVPHTDAGNFVVEWHPLFGNQRVAAKLSPRLVQVAEIDLDDKLAFAVVAQATSLDDHRQSEFLGGGVEIFPRVDGVVAGQRNPELVKQRFFGQPVLCVPQRCGRRVDRHNPLDVLQRRDRHVFELVGDKVTGLRERDQRNGVVERCLNHLSAGRGRRIFGWVDVTTLDA